MNSAIKETTRFSIVIAFSISIIATVLLGFILWYLDRPIVWISLFFGLFVFAISYGLIKFGANKYIFSSVNQIYDELEIPGEKIFKRTLINTDMDALREQVKTYTKTRNSEIETLKGKDAYRKEFLGNVAHELKTPLFTIQGYILTLLGGAKDSPELCEKYLDRANKGVERLEYIIKDLDQITKLEAGEFNLELEVFDIVSLIESVYEVSEIKASKKNITLMFDQKYDPIYVMADKGRIHQVLVNLIINSLKYGHENGTTEISIEELIDSKLIVRVTDNGEGIKDENISRLFERFYRVDRSRSREIGGSGLGLAIVKHIIEAHNEQIYVESVHGIGSEFSFTIEKANL